MTVAETLTQVRQNIEAAKARGAYAKKDVLLLAVTKTVSVERIREAVDLGAHDLGENRVQELISKYDELPGVNWHLIGHLQTNKVKYIIDKVKLVHSLDSIELTKEIDKRAKAAGVILPVLVQVNIADEETKFGLAENEVEDFLAAMEDYPSLAVQGLMTIGPFLPEPEELRPVFRSLRLLSERIQGRNLPHISMDFLSMGMSNDYEVAVEEGANIVRIGSSIFGKR